jgi:hypothetical protein
MEQTDRLSVEECRELLGPDGEGWTDERIEQLRDRLENMAHVLLPIVKTVSREDVEAMKWAAFALRHGPMEELVDNRGNEFNDLESWPLPEGQCRAN